MTVASPFQLVFLFSAVLGPMVEDKTMGSIFRGVLDFIYGVDGPSGSATMDISCRWPFQPSRKDRYENE